MDEQTIWLIESPITMIEGEEVAYSVEWQGAARLEDVEATVFKNAVDITADTMNSGDDHLVNGNVLTLKRLAARTTDGGSRYVLLIEASVDGNLERRKLLVHVVRANAES